METNFSSKVNENGKVEANTEFRIMQGRQRTRSVAAGCELLKDSGGTPSVVSYPHD